MIAPTTEEGVDLRLRSFIANSECRRELGEADEDSKLALAFSTNDDRVGFVEVVVEIGRVRGADHHPSPCSLSVLSMRLEVEVERSSTDFDLDLGIAVVLEEFISVEEADCAVWNDIPDSG